MRNWEKKRLRVVEHEIEYFFSLSYRIQQWGMCNIFSVIYNWAIKYSFFDWHTRARRREHNQELIDYLWTFSDFSSSLVRELRRKLKSWEIITIILQSQARIFFIFSIDTVRKMTAKRRTKKKSDLLAGEERNVNEINSGWNSGFG